MIAVGLQQSVANLLPPPDGGCDSIKSLRELLLNWAPTDVAKRVGAGKILMGFGYDDAQLKERRHPTRHDLDAVSKDKPVVIIHQSGHIGVLNTKALEIVGVNESTANPAGGVIRREEDGKTPNGVLEETAWIKVLTGNVLPFVSQGNFGYFLEKGQDACASFGYTTVQEGRATPGEIVALGEAAMAGQFRLDLVAYQDPFSGKSGLDPRWHGPEYKGHFRVGGIKVNLDGSPAGKTAWLTKPYKVPPPGRGENYRGYPTFSDGVLFPVIKEAVGNKVQILAHCNGDAASDQFIASLRQAGTPEQLKAIRPVMIHAQTVREDQLDEMAKLGIIPSFFSMHTYYWGDWHRDETLGRERAYRISPAVSALKRNMVWTSHHDAPVALPDSIRILSSCVTRKSRSGDVIGPDQRVSMAEALKALTINAAWQYGEESRKGSIEVGKRADLVILSANPLKIDPERIMDLKIIETIKDGKTVYPMKK
jgi:predicted amidohydrolase YtcJ